MATITLTQVADFAALELGVLDSGESLSTQQLADFLLNFNNLVDNWSSESAMVVAVVIAQFNLVGGTQSYTIGTGQTFNTARPVDIPAAAHILPISGVEQAQTPVRILNAKEWAQIPNRRRTSLIPSKLFYDHGFPFGNVYLSNVPAAASILELTMWSPLPQFADTTTAITIPPGYSDLYGLAGAVAMAPQFSEEPSASLKERYADEIARIRNLNFKLLGEGPAPGQTSAAQVPGEAPVPGAR